MFNCRYSILPGSDSSLPVRFCNQGTELSKQGQYAFTQVATEDATSDTFTEVADALRHKVRLSLEAETYRQAVAAFNGSTGLTTATVLDKTWNAVELVGKPISVSQFVNEVNQGGAAFSSRALTYTPYFRLGDAVDSRGALDDRTTGTAFQEFLTNFPLGSTILTGLTLNVDLTLPGGGNEHYERAMVDRIGYAARQNSTAATFSVDANGQAALSAADNATVSVLSSRSSLGEPVGLQTRVRQLEESLRPFAGVTNAQLPADYGSRLNDFVLNATRLLARIHSREADDMSRSIARWERIAAYEDRPRLVLTIGRFEPGTATAPGSVEFTIDLRRDLMRSVVAPGQTVVASAAYHFTRGLLTTEIERQILAGITPATQQSALFNTNTVLQNARAQQIPVLTLFPADANNLDNLLTASSDFVVFASANGSAQGTAQGTLTLAGTSIPPDTDAHGIAASITPTTNPLDVSGDAFVSPIDALLVIDYLNAAAASSLSAQTFPVRLDVNRDAAVSPVDALLIINFLNARTSASLNGEGESAPVDVQQPAIGLASAVNASSRGGNLSKDSTDLLSRSSQEPATVEGRISVPVVLFDKDVIDDYVHELTTEIVSSRVRQLADDEFFRELDADTLLTLDRIMLSFDDFEQ